MTADPRLLAVNRENACILLEEGRQQYKQQQIAAARASFKEAASLDPSNREVWLCLASVSTGEEQAEYLKRAARKGKSSPLPKTKEPLPKTKEPTPPAQPAVPPGLSVPLARLKASSFYTYLPYTLVGILLVVTVVLTSLAVYRVWNRFGVLNDGYTRIDAEQGGKINYKGMAGLYVPSGSLMQSERFNLSTPTEVPPLPDQDLFAPVGSPVQVNTSASVLRQPIWVGFRYDPGALPAGADEKGLQVARWDGSSWEFVEGEFNYDQKLVYVPVTHFSEPVFTLAAWAPAVTSTVMDQVKEANQAYYQSPEDGSAAAQYESIVRQFQSAEQLNALSANDRRGYWMACNMWGESLYRAGQYDQAGAAFQTCVDTALASGSVFDWGDRLLASPGYALNALQNRYPLGTALVQALHTQAWAAFLPADELTLAAESFAWRYNTPVELDDLPQAIRSEIEDYESTLDRNPSTSISTSLDLLVLSPQAQITEVLPRTMEQTLLPFVQTSGIADISSSAIQADAAGLQPILEALLRQPGASNRYISVPAQPGEDRHTHAPLILVRVERVWDGPNGLTHTQHVFTISHNPSTLGAAVGEPISQEAAYKLNGSSLEQAVTQDRWINLGATITSAIQAVHVFNDQSLAAGSDFTCALTNLNGVRCWGSNQYGQLGIGDTADSLAPRDVPGLSYGVRQIATGESHTCALSSEGSVSCWGNNSSGQLGNGNNDTQLSPVLVAGLAEPVVSISAGAMHSCALTESGAVYCWGNNLSGQLGDGSTNTASIPRLVAGVSGAKAISAGASHTCALLSNGGMSCWGSNERGQLGNGGQQSSLLPVDVPGLSGVAAITTGQEHTCALLSSGGVKCWGLNAAGQVGSGSGESFVIAPEDVKDLQSGVLSIKAFKNHTCIVNASGLMCWGLNNAGQIGNGSQENQFVPVLVSGAGTSFVGIGAGSEHTCARTGNGYIYCWGSNSHGQLGDRSTISSLAPVAVVGFGTSV
ncbi:MAG: hypothetical protein GYA17_03190, partial [Chloroflexi bacterium]|nr:hypothetical protein [Chloroflexota bacterium]